MPRTYTPNNGIHFRFSDTHIVTHIIEKGASIQDAPFDYFYMMIICTDGWISADIAEKFAIDCRYTLFHVVVFDGDYNIEFG